MTFVDQRYQRADAFLFGRWTYDFFAGYWGAMDLGSGLSGDLAAAIGELKATPGGELQVYRSARRPQYDRLNNHRR